MQYPQHQQQSHEPRMYHSLKVALASLYSLPLPETAARPSPHQAHEFLLHVQSRNSRRKIQSMFQRQRDSGTKGNPKNSSDSTGVAVEMGSTWLACIFLLMDAHSTSTEKLFCAQTLLHRLRRAKMAEAIDWELERPTDITSLQECWQFSVDPTQMAVNYKDWIRSQNTMVGAILDTVDIQQSNNIISGAGFTAQEDRCKGELSLLTLSSILSISLLDYQNNNSLDSTIPPLATTLGGVIAMIALRLRYSTNNIANNDANTQQQQHPTLVLLAAHSLQAVGATMSAELAQSTPHQQHLIQPTLEMALDSCLGAIPDTILGSPGGARGRLSIDPKCIQAATTELRTQGLVDLWSLLCHRQRPDQGGSGAGRAAGVLTICVQWAKYLPMPLDFVQQTCPLINSCLENEGSREAQLALAYLIAILEGGAWSLDEVLAYNLGLSEQQQVQQATKKRQTSRSKKRQKGHIDARSSDAVVENAMREVHARGQVACVANSLVWDRLLLSAHRDLQALSADASMEVAGEGSIACLAASANACLPHIVRNPSETSSSELFLAISRPFQEICKSSNKSARGIAMEALYSLHSAVVEVIAEKGPLGDQLEDLIVNHFYECCMGLAASCGYPTGYFENLCADSDEELEVERNDVRDVLRCITGSEESKQSTEQIKEPFQFSLRILFMLVKACSESIAAAHLHKVLCTETVVHAFSSLAKSLNQVASFLKAGESSKSCSGLVDLVLSTTSAVMDNAYTGFDNSAPIEEFLPLCRISVIIAASISPFLAVFCETERWHSAVADCVHKAVNVAARSIEVLPELFGQSSLGRAMYDIRGTMRGPGGEDHVGCLTLMRLVFESDGLAAMTSQVSTDFMQRMCTIHENLKRAEIERGVGIWHGQGVAPKSRRILLNVLCHLEALSQGSLGASQVLTDLFNAAIRVPLSLKDRTCYDAKDYFDMTEAILDITSFTPRIVASLFSGGDDIFFKERTSCLETLTFACCDGYRKLHVIDGEIVPSVIQWNRLRYSLFYLLKTVGSPDVPPLAAEMISALTKAECEAVHRQCSAGPDTLSSIFNDDIVSPEMVPAGVHLRTISEVIRSQRGIELEHIPQCVKLLVATKDCIFSTILLECPEPHFVDPRPCIMEVWLLTITDMIQTISKEDLDLDSALMNVAHETLSVIVHVMMYPRLRRIPSDGFDPGASFDGPNSLAITEFFVAYFGLGPVALEHGAKLLVTHIPADLGAATESNDQLVRGIAILGAALFRGVQGTLPPWTVEHLPEVYAGFYSAMGKNASTFCGILRMSMEVRLPSDNGARFGGVEPGSLLSGCYFEGLNVGTRDKFISDIHSLASKDDTSSWKRVKVLIKQICGGKKKDNRQQKPSPTRWDFDRL